MYKSIDPQDQCRFFAAPTEIRDAIYAHLIPGRIHISLCEKKIRLSPCVQREKDDDADCFSRESYDTNSVKIPCAEDLHYIRRLRSHWGPHWRCEETIIRREEGCKMNHDTTTMALLLVCKRMFTDVVEATAGTVTIEITDLNTLESMVSNTEPDVSAAIQPCTAYLLRRILPNLKRLNITLRLPLAVYEEPAAADESAPSKSSLVSIWTELPLAFEQLSSLRRLKIWMDHEEPCSWSMVNERAVLSPFASLSRISGLSVVINLPKLHPKWATPDRHFTENSPPLPLDIRRRYRQRHHCIQDRNGGHCSRYEPDFPVLHELIGCAEYATQRRVGGMTAEEVEEMETRSWKMGEDPVEEYICIPPQCGLHPI